MRHHTRRVVALVSATAFITFGAVAASTAEAAPPSGEAEPSGQTHTYIVELAGAPVVTYDGDIGGLRATRPGNGQKINPNSAAVRKYADHLRGSHDQALALVGGTKGYDYFYAFNGFSATMTDVAAEKLAQMPGVLAVSSSEILQLDTSYTPDFLGLTDPDGLWAMLGGPIGSKQHQGAGEDVIVGIIDSGITPESLSFTDRDSGGKLMYQQIPGWHGRCVPGDDFNGSDCNHKLIGAQYFNAGFGGDAGVRSDLPYEFISARDFDGHGTHTASTAAGNAGVPAVVAGYDFGTISGMAPRARVAAYKVCWGTGEEGGCASEDSVAAIDQAVADGVDVLNYSISGSLTTSRDPVEIAFMNAAAAGVFVAASAGNSGDTVGPSSVAHNSPWLMTVAASTHGRVGNGSVTLGNGATYAGASLATLTGPAPFAESASLALAGADLNEARLCYPGTLDPTKTAGTIVLCDRGAIARVDKSAAVAMASGIGMVMVNTSPIGVNADAHFVPSVHIEADAYGALHAYAATPGAVATLNEATLAFDGSVEMAGFSSYGPALAHDGDLLKPDITAPGVDILAAVAPPGNAGRNVDFLSGTSMSGPHMAGLGALLIDLHPDWTPMMIKSAFMTTAVPLDGAGALNFGSGHVVPNSAADPGLVYNSGPTDWLGFLCGSDLPTAFCDDAGVPVLDPSDLNYPSIAVGALAGTQTVTRTVTNVGSAGTYRVSVDAPTGIDIVVEPAQLTLASGASASYSVTMTTTEAATQQTYTEGSLTWSDGTHSVRSPIVAKPVAIAAPAEVTSTGSTAFEVGFGGSGAFDVDVMGLLAATQTVATITDDPGNSFAIGGPGVIEHTFVVPDGTPLIRFALFDDDTAGNDDLDLNVYVEYLGDLYPEGSSGSGTSNEAVTLAGYTGLGDLTYHVFVHAYQTDGGAPTDYTLSSWILDGTDAGNLGVSAPASAVLGETGTISLDASALDAETRYFGELTYLVDGIAAGTSLVSVNTP